MERAIGYKTRFDLLSPKTFDSYFLDMMYVEFLKNSYLTDSSELMAVRVISVSWAQKRLIPTFETWCTSSWWKILNSPIRASWWLRESFRHPEPKNVWFLLSRHDVRRVMKNFRLSDSSELLAIRLVLTYWAQKCLIPTFETWCTSSSWKIFFSPIQESCWLLHSFWPHEPKNVWFLLSRHDVRRVHEKFLSRWSERADSC